MRVGNKHFVNPHSNVGERGYSKVVNISIAAAASGVFIIIAVHYKKRIWWQTDFFKKMG